MGCAWNCLVPPFCRRPLGSALTRSPDLKIIPALVRGVAEKEADFVPLPTPLVSCVEGDHFPHRSQTFPLPTPRPMKWPCDDLRQ